MAINRTNNKRDRNQTLIDYLVYERGNSFVSIAQHKVDRHRKTLEAVAEQSGEKMEAIACAGVGAIAFVGGIMAGVTGLAAAGFVLAPIAGLALKARAAGEAFAAKEHEFLRLNSQMIEYMAGMEQRGDLPSHDLADLYTQIFAERCHRNNLLVTPDIFKAALAGMANSRIGSKATVAEFAKAMETQTEMQLPIAPEPEPEPEYYEPEPPQSAPFRFSAFGDTIDVSVTPTTAPLSLPPERDSLSDLWEVVDAENSYFIVGSKGAGKGMLVANLLRRKLEQYPNATVLVFDPKGDSKEDGYWDHPRIVRKSFKGISSAPAKWAEEASSFIATAYHMMGQCDIRSGKRLFIVFDELLACKTNLDKMMFEEIKTLCSNGISMGDSEGIHAIAITQSMNAGDAFDSEEIMKNMCFTAVLRENDFNRAKKLVKFGKVNTDQLTEGEFERMKSESPVKRVLTIGGKFMSTPQLVNYSTYDRDSESSIGPVAQPSRTFEAGVATITKEPPRALRTEIGKTLVTMVREAGLREVITQVIQLNEIGQERSAFKVMIEALGSPSKTSFCRSMGSEGGSRFQAVGDLYEWVMG